MKQFIVLLAVLPILMIFLLQFTQDQINGERVAIIQSVVYAAKEEAKQEGCFTDEICGKIRSEISGRLSIPEERISIDADSEVKYRYADGDGRLIRYKVSVELDNVMAGGSFLGIDENENSALYVIESYTASERI